MLDVRRLRLLRELARRGTIAAVAEALAFSPSAVSQQLAVLEREAGLPLLERTGRRVRLTPAAQNLVRHADAVLERLEQADADLAEARSGLAGVLRIGSFPTATRAIVPAALVHLARRHPGLEPMISETDPAAVAHALRAGDLDVALVHEYDFVPVPAEPGLATRPLYGEAMYLAALAPADPGPGPAAAGADPGAPQDGAPGQDAVLRAHRDAPWITATPGTLCHAMTVRACQAAGFTPGSGTRSTSSPPSSRWSRRARGWRSYRSSASRGPPVRPSSSPGCAWSAVPRSPSAAAPGPTPPWPPSPPP